MNFYLNLLLTLSITLPAVAAWIRFPKIQNVYYPFIWMVWLAFYTELCSIQIVLQHYPNVILYNLFGIAEVVLILHFFYLIRVIQRRELYIFLQALFGCWWIAESFLFSSIREFNSYFFIGSSFVIVFLAMMVISKLLVVEKRGLLHNSRFLIAAGLSLYFSYSIIVEAFWIFGINRTEIFRSKILDILSYINFITNLIFTRAVLWLPTKYRYIMQL